MTKKISGWKKGLDNQFYQSSIWSWTLRKYNFYYIWPWLLLSDSQCCKIWLVLEESCRCMNCWTTFVGAHISRNNLQTWVIDKEGDSDILSPHYKYIFFTFFFWLQHLHNYFTVTLGVPAWCSYVFFIIATLIFGLFMGLVRDNANLFSCL